MFANWKTWTIKWDNFLIEICFSCTEGFRFRFGLKIGCKIFQFSNYRPRTNKIYLDGRVFRPIIKPRLSFGCDISKI